MGAVQSIMAIKYFLIKMNKNFFRVIFLSSITQAVHILYFASVIKEISQHITLRTK